MKGALAAVLVAAFVLAGCSSKTTPPAGDTFAPTPPETQSPAPAPAAPKPTTNPAPSTPSKSPNKAPSAILAASITKGAMPLLVNFTLDGADPDKDPLTYTFDVDGQTPVEGAGSEFPIRTNHTYALLGIYNVTFTVSDGKLTTTERLSINVTAAAIGRGPIQSVSLTWTVPNAGCAPASYPTWPFASPAAGKAWAEITVDPRTIGLPYKAHLTFTDPSTQGAAASGMDFYAATSADIGPGSPAPPVPGPANDVFEYWTDGGYYVFAGEPDPHGIVPTGAHHALFYDCATTGGSTVVYTAG